MRLKRIQFWGRDEYDDHLLQEILDGLKTATVCPAREFDVPAGEYDDGGYAVGDIVEVYDNRPEPQLRCRIEITEVYNVPFGDIPEKLWRGEATSSAEDFRDAHRRCWPDLDLTDDFPLTATHFRLVEVVQA